jgi:hypothetical protein
VGAGGGERERAAEDGARHVFDALPLHFGRVRADGL